MTVVIVPAALAAKPPSTILTKPSLPAAPLASVCVTETVVVPVPPLTMIPPVFGARVLFSVIVVVKLPLTVRAWFVD